MLAGELVWTDDTPFDQSVHGKFSEMACHACYNALDGGLESALACVAAGTKLYVPGSHFNHSSSPSAVASFVGRTLRIHVIRDIELGDEITIPHAEIYDHFLEGWKDGKGGSRASRYELGPGYTYSGSTFLLRTLARRCLGVASTYSFFVESSKPERRLFDLPKVGHRIMHALD